jgi:hypothetical protein
MTEILRAAFKYLDEGFSVFPVDRQTKKPLVKWSEFQKRLPTKLEWQRWVTTWPTCNLGLITGYWGHRVVLDFDEKDAFTLWYTETIKTTPTLLIATSRGFHVHFTLADHPGKSFVAKHPDGDRLEVKACGNFVVVPPSIHSSGNPYLVVSPSPPAVIKDIDSVLGNFARPVPPQPPLPLRKFDPVKVNGRLSKVDAVKQVFRIETFLPEFEGKQDARGRVGVGCPLPGHDDNHVSFWYHPVEQVCSCAKCTGQGTWDVINLYAAIHSLTNTQAIDELYQLTPQGLKEER